MDEKLHHEVENLRKDLALQLSRQRDIEQELQKTKSQLNERITSERKLVKEIESLTTEVETRKAELERIFTDRAKRKTSTSSTSSSHSIPDTSRLLNIDTKEDFDKDHARAVIDSLEKKAILQQKTIEVLIILLYLTL
jgi:hypothetical protein